MDDGILEQLQLPFEEMHISIPQNEFFPRTFKIYEFCADNETVFREVTYTDVSSWLFAKENKKFVFQCLLCQQEMIFRVVFKHENYFLDRSHLLTEKHNRNVKNVDCVGLLFTTSKKFVMLKEVDYRRGQVFDLMKKVKRRDIPLANEKIVGQVFCNQYNMYTYDRQRNALEKDTENNRDLVAFMKSEVRPLFSLYCLYCDLKASTYTQVIEHLCSKRHRKKISASKGNIISVRDYNIFITCDFKKLSSFLHVTHLNSYLEEIIIGGEGTLVITGNYNKDGKSKPNDGDVRVKADPVKLPEGMTKNESVRISTRFTNYDAVDNPDWHNDCDKSLSKSSARVQRNVTIYEFSSNSFNEYYADNLIFSVFGNIGCGVWCDRCCLPIYSPEGLQAHMSSERHISRIRNNELIGFMCHTCNYFIIALKGECIAHIHSSKESNKIKQLFAAQAGEMSNATLNEDINSVYSDQILNISEPVKFCCLGCFDMAKIKLSSLSGHGKNLGRHQDYNYMFSFCNVCNVIYITNKTKNHDNYFFKEHFATHLNSNDVVTYRLHWRDSSTIQFEDFTIDESTFSSKYKPKFTTTEKRIKVRASKFFSQLVHPGVSKNEFDSVEEWTKNSLVNYITTVGREKLRFSCLACQFETTDVELLNKHLFQNNHETNTLLYIKFCDVCEIMLFSATIVKLQEHFSYCDHTNNLLHSAGIPQYTVKIWEFHRASIKLTNNVFASGLDLHRTILKDVMTMKALSINNNNTFQKLTDSIKLVLSKHFTTDIDIEFYGSRVSGLAMDNSNIHLSIIVGNDNFDKVVNSLRSATQTFKVVNIIKDSPTPLIQVTQVENEIICNIILTSNIEKYCSMLIKIYINFDERVHMLLAAIRRWTILLQLKNVRKLNSHTVNWLVLFYLMQPDVRVIPPVSYVIQTYGGLEGVLRYENSLSCKEKKMDVKKTYLELIEGFFHYYSFMNFSKYKLCPYDGSVILNDTGEQFYLEDPVSRDNVFSNMEATLPEQFRNLCSLTLNMAWRIN